MVDSVLRYTIHYVYDDDEIFPSFEEPIVVFQPVDLLNFPLTFPKSLITVNFSFMLTQP